MGQPQPPLTRAGRGGALAVGAVAASTPAYAGRTPMRRSGLLRRSLNPRLRGPDSNNDLADLSFIPQPPLTRAGLPQPARYRPGRPLNPRLRGPDRCRGSRSLGYSPQPPLTRAGLGVGGACGGCGASTPAYAGRTPSAPPSAAVSTLNPRLRGLDVALSAPQQEQAPQPPLTRAGRAGLTGPPRDRASTPAYAGWTPHVT